MTDNQIYGRGWILAALMLTMMLAAMDSTIISTAIPHIVSSLGGFNKFSWVFSIYLLAQTVTIPIYGKITDLYGRKKILLFGIFVFLLGSLLSGSAWNIESLIFFRGIQGIGAGSMMATVNTIAGDIYSVEERAKIQGFLSSIWGISAILGPAIGGTLAEYANWRWIFLINLPIGAISIYVIYNFFKEKLVPINPKIDYKGLFFILSSLILFFIFLLEGGQSWQWISAPSIILFILFIISTIISFIIESKSEDAILPMWLWQDRTFAFTNLAMIGMGIVMIGPEIFLPTFAQTSLGLGAVASGFILTTMSFGWPTASALSGKLYLRIGFRETSLIGSIVIFLACVGFLLIPKPQAVYLLVIDQIMIGAGFGLLSTSSLVGIQSMVNWEKRGVVTSSNIFARNLGQSLGATIVGAIFNNSLTNQLQNAPSELPHSIKDILSIFHNPAISESAKEFLRNAINFSMQHIYWGLASFSIFIFICIYNVPSRKVITTSKIK